MVGIRQGMHTMLGSKLKTRALPNEPASQEPRGMQNGDRGSVYLLDLLPVPDQRQTVDNHGVKAPEALVDEAHRQRVPPRALGGRQHATPVH